MTGKKALSAKWCANCYSVWYMPNGTDGEQTEQAGLLYDTEFKILDNMYKKEGYTFAGWSTLADGSSEIYKAGESIKTSRTKTERLSDSMPGGRKTHIISSTI